MKDCDECGGVNIRPKNGINYSVHLVKKVRKTAAAEVEVEDQVTTVDDKPQVVNSDGDLEDPPSENENERISTPPLGEAEMTQASSCVVSEDYLLANKRARENNPPEEDDDTIEIIYDPESDSEILDESTQPAKILRIQ